MAYTSPAGTLARDGAQPHPGRIPVKR
jgi:hypothetical protein